MFKILVLNPTYKPNTLTESFILKPDLQSVLSADRYKIRNFKNTNKNDYSYKIYFTVFLEKDELFQKEVVSCLE
jgi:nicotinic acid phosphoribosyltransferase